MTVAAAAAKAGPYTGNDVTSSFAFSFKVFADADIRVVETVIATGVESDLVLNTNYTVSRNADQDTSPGGTITYKVGGVTTALPSTKKLTIVGDFDYAQPTDIPNGGSFFANIIELAFDRVTLLIKQLKEQSSRALVFPVSDADPTVELPVDRASKYLAFDVDGNPVASSGTTSLAVITPFMETVLDDTTAAAARATLGAAASATSAVSGANADITSLTALTSINGGSISGLRNIIINGGFTVNQRGYVSAAALASGTYGHDRWKAGSGGGDYSFTQLDSDTTITIAANKTLIQVIEDKNVQATSYLLSWTGTAQARYAVNSDTPAGAYAASPILITGQTAGDTLSVEFGNGASAGTLGKVSLRAATVSTVEEFEARPYGLELALCQRYYWRRNWTNGQYIGSMGQAYSASSAYGMRISAPVPMRAAPTTISSSALGNFSLGDAASTPAAVTTTFSLVSSGADGDVVVAQADRTGNGLVAGNACLLTTTSSVFIAAEAEL